MSEDNSPEQQRQERAKLVNAFSRQAWQPSERPQLGPRLLAGGLALVVVAGVVFGLGAMKSYNDKKSAEQRARRAALTARSGQTASNPSPDAVPPPAVTPTPTPTPTPAKTRERAAKGTLAREKHVRRARPVGPRLATIKRVVIKNVMTGECVDIPGYGKGSVNGPVGQYSCDGSRNDNQRWDLVVGQRGAGPGGANLFTIRNSTDGLCLDLPGYGQVDKADMAEYTCRPGSGDNQMWYLEAKGKGRFWIRSTGAGDRCLDVAGFYGVGGNDARLTVYPCDIRDDHLWSFS